MVAYMRWGRDLAGGLLGYYFHCTFLIHIRPLYSSHRDGIEWTYLESGGITSTARTHQRMNPRSLRRQGVGHLVHKLKFTIPIFEEPSVCHVIDGILERSSVDPNYRELHGKHSVSYDVSNPPDGTNAYILVWLRGGKASSQPSVVPEASEERISQARQ